MPYSTISLPSSDERHRTNIYLPQRRSGRKRAQRPFVESNPKTIWGRAIALARYTKGFAHAHLLAQGAGGPLWVIYGLIRSRRQPGKGQERPESGPKSALVAEGDYVPNKRHSNTKARRYKRAPSPTTTNGAQ
jgi:hypothetical protein